MTRDEGAPGGWALTVIAVLLTMGSAAADIMAFTRLGNVFASVMTSNILFLGLAAARRSGTLAAHAAVSFAGYVAGVAAASRLARRPSPGTSAASQSPWTPWVAAALGVEAVMLVGFTIGWEVTGARPSGGTQLLLIFLATLAMGMQSAVVVILNISRVATTYLTGTLTALIDSLARPGEDRGTAQREANIRRASVLAGLVVGALLAGLLITAAPAAVPAIPLAALAAVLLIGLTRLRDRQVARNGR